MDQILASEFIGSPNETHWYFGDHLGTIRDVYSYDDSVNEVVPEGHIEYDTFGNIVDGLATAAAAHYAYTGREWDPDVELYYYRARYYDPRLAQFISADPLGFAAGDENLYRYVGNEATSARDPSGLKTIDVRVAAEQVLGVKLPDELSDAAAQRIVRKVPGAAIGLSMHARAPGKGLAIPFTFNNEKYTIIYEYVTPGLFTSGFYYKFLGAFKTNGTPAAMIHEKVLKPKHDANARNSVAAGQITGEIAVSALPGVGEALDLKTLADPNEPLWSRGLALGSLGLSLISLGFAPNYGAARRGIKEACETMGKNAAERAIIESGAIKQLDNLLPILNPTCFAAGTPILTPEGSRAIERLAVGDLVLSRPEDDLAAPIRAQRVEAIFERLAQILEIRLGGRVIETTDEHPFYVAGSGWVKANALQPGDRLIGHDEIHTPIESIQMSERSATVYNFRVAEDHTYFVGGRDWGFSVWVHNAKYRVVPDVDGTYKVIDEHGVEVSKGLKSSSEAQSLADTFNAPKGVGVGPDDVIPDGFSFDIDNPLYRRFKSGNQVLEYSLDGGHLSVDWVDGGGAGPILKRILEAEGGSVRRISGYATDRLGELSDEALLRYGRQVARQLGDGWTPSIRMDGTKRFLEFTR